MRRAALLLGLLLIGCDGGNTGESSGGEVAVEPGPKYAPKAAESATAGSTPASRDSGAVEPTPVEREREPEAANPLDPESAEAFEALAQELSGDETKPVDATSKQAWKHYKAREWDEAAVSFARVALDDPAWKHPHNAACASSQGGQLERARTFLAESLRRGGKAARKRARNDKDLAAVQNAAWFRPLVSEPDGAGGETPGDADDRGEASGELKDCDEVPIGCDAAEWKDRCHRFFPHHYRAEAAEALTSCIQQKGCKQQSKCEAALTAKTTSEARALCKEMGEDYSDHELESEAYAHWNEQKSKCVPLMSLLTREGREGSRDCFQSDCPDDGCELSLAQCVHPEMMHIWTHWDVELKLEP